MDEDEIVLSDAQKKDVKYFKEKHDLSRLSYDELRGMKRIFTWQARDRRLLSDRLVAQKKVDMIQEEMDKRNK